MATNKTGIAPLGTHYYFGLCVTTITGTQCPEQLDNSDNNAEHEHKMHQIFNKIDDFYIKAISTKKLILLESIIAGLICIKEINLILKKDISHIEKKIDKYKSIQKTTVLFRSIGAIW